MLDQFDGFQILIAAVHIGDPLPVLFTVVQIEHAGHRIHPDTVRMIFFHPEQGVGDQVIGYLGTAVIVDQGSPVRMASLSGILMLVEAGTVEAGQSVSVSGEMGGYPVKNHSDPRLVQFVYEEHEVLRGAVSGGGCIIADHLIAPGSIQRMFHDRHQFHMGVSHLFHIVDDLRCDLTIVRIILSLPRRHKASQIHLIDADRSISALIAFPLF